MSVSTCSSLHICIVLLATLLIDVHVYDFSWFDGLNDEKLYKQTIPSPMTSLIKKHFPKYTGKTSDIKADDQ